MDYLRLIKIVIHPTSQTVKLRRAEETVTLQCHAESLGGQELVYRWYYLKGNEKPSNIDMKSRAVKGTGPSIDIVVESTIKKLKRRYFCSVAVVDQPEYRVASKEAVITLQHG